MRMPVSSLGALLGAVLILLFPGVALADVEPANDYLASAEGPITTPTVTASGNSDGDQDWYLIYVNGPTQLTATVDDPSSDDGCARVELYDTVGDRLGGLPYSTPAGVQRYFVLVTTRFLCQTPMPYTLTLGPASALVAGPAMPTSAGIVEPNETPQSASGPLAGAAWYSGVLETVNDQDWMTFYLAPGTHQLSLWTIELPGHGCSDGPTMEMFRDYPTTNSGPVTKAAVISNKYTSGNVTATGPGRYFLKAAAYGTGDVGCGWMTQVAPQGALAPSLIVPVVQRPASTTPTITGSCARARARVRTYKSKVYRYKKIYRRSHGSKRKRYVRKYKSARKQLNRSYRQRAAHCPGGQ
ncbi:MAG: hypothetical protein ACSLFR_00555 [Solirubrobacteraceae bacterium]